MNAPRLVSSGKRHGLRHSVKACTFILLCSCRARTRAKWAMSILAVAWCDGDIRRSFLLISLYASPSVGSTEVRSGSSEAPMSLEMCKRSAESMGSSASGSCRRYSCVTHGQGQSGLDWQHPTDTGAWLHAPTRSTAETVCTSCRSGENSKVISSCSISCTAC